MFNELLDIFVSKSQIVEEEYNEIRNFELFNRIKSYVLDASVIITAVPLGPLEVLSLPFWTTYFSMGQLVKLRENYNRWKIYGKIRIAKDNFL